MCFIISYNIPILSNGFLSTVNKNDAYLPKSDETITSDPLLCSRKGKDFQAIWT